MKTPRASLKPPTFNVAPLLDVTFLLIVFFVLTGRLVQDEVAMEMSLPRETSGKSVEDESDKIVINVVDADSFYLGARRVSLDELGSGLRKERSRTSRKIAVRIRANRDVPYYAIEPILLVCAQSGFPDVSFAVTEE